LAFGDAVTGGSMLETDEALADGRIDTISFNAINQPTDFPVSSLVSDASVAGTESGYLISQLQKLGAINEAWWQVPELQEELSAEEITLLMPMSNAPTSALACREPLTSLADLQGKQIRAGSASSFGQIEALGATAVSITFSDLFESLQRGIVDC